VSRSARRSAALLAAMTLAAFTAVLAVLDAPWAVLTPMFGCSAGIILGVVVSDLSRNR
jgi:hypothetical protein